MKVKITKAGGYDPRLGPKHPDNRDPTLESTVEDGVLHRRVRIDADAGRVTISEVDDNGAFMTVMDDRERQASIVLNSDQLWNMAVGILTLFGATAHRRDALRVKIFAVLHANESRCLDDDIDFDVVLNELMKALAPT